MQTSEIIKNLRKERGLTQDELAAKLFVTRQAVSKWERAEALPDTDTLIALSKLFEVSINTLLASPRKLICQCCGMTLDDSSIARNPDGSFNEDYCKWCLTDGEFVYKTPDELIDFLTDHLSNEKFPPDKAREYFSKLIPTLGHWK